MSEERKPYIAGGKFKRNCYAIVIETQEDGTRTLNVGDPTAPDRLVLRIPAIGPDFIDDREAAIEIADILDATARDLRRYAMGVG